MIYTKQQIAEACKTIAPIYSIRPEALYALARKECDRTKSGDFDASTPRLEQGFFENYLHGNSNLPANLSTVVLAMMAVSYGAWQCMGYELWRLGYLRERYEAQTDEQWKKILDSPTNDIAVAQAFDYLCVDVNIACKYAAILLNEKKAIAARMESFKGSTNKLEMAYLLWNGGGDVSYGRSVIALEAAGLPY